MNLKKFLLTVLLVLITFWLLKRLIDYSLTLENKPNMAVINSVKRSRYDYIVVGAGTASSVLVRRLVDGFAEGSEECETKPQGVMRARSGRLTYEKLIHALSIQKQCPKLCFRYKPRILMIEAGSKLTWFQRKLSEIPLTCALLFGTGADQVYETVPQNTASLQMKNRQLLLPAGRILGGTAMLNAMIFSLGHPSDVSYQMFHKWYPRFYEEIFPFMNENEKSQLYRSQKDGCQFRPQPVYRHPVTRRIHSVLSTLFRDLGFPVEEEPSGWNAEGLQTPLVFTESGKRWSPYGQCIEPLLKRPDNPITIISDAIVEKLVFAPDSNTTVTGVQVYQRGLDFSVHLKEISSLASEAPTPEVILSAGTFETPALLMRSGAGRRKIAHEHSDISNLLDLPVGQNLHDQPMIGLICTVREQVSINSRIITIKEILRYFWDGKSALSQASALSSIAYLRTTLQRSYNITRPDIQYTFIAASPFENENFRKFGHMRPEAWLKFVPSSNHDLKNTIIILVTLTEPASRGYVSLGNRTKQNFPQPVVNPSYLADPNDLDRLVEGVSWIYSVLMGKAVTIFALPGSVSKPPQVASATTRSTLERLGLHLHLPTYSGCPQWPRKEQPTLMDQWKASFTCLVRSATLSIYHYAGTCPAGESQDSAVVNINLKLIGAKNVRVADASVIPTLPTANPAAHVMAIGNYGGQSILNEYYQKITNSLTDAG
ncbi:unnamed protein product [Calicophoron daubneyi]|uniref:Glucose-methanol-choline oxidoreductase N-terminal domain-containing protein n=1 Tax=Calicophoron daubneyi TaxID=300641 RepID=A0AAV2TFG2_CALDB